MTAVGACGRDARQAVRSGASAKMVLPEFGRRNALIEIRRWQRYGRTPSSEPSTEPKPLSQRAAHCDGASASPLAGLQYTDIRRCYSFPRSTPCLQLPAVAFCWRRHSSGAPAPASCGADMGTVDASATAGALSQASAGGTGQLRSAVSVHGRTATWSKQGPNWPRIPAEHGADGRRTRATAILRFTVPRYGEGSDRSLPGSL